jgi:glycosyltransferase involved in cell wall biosynthesis
MTIKISKKISILGIRGIPAEHGGFESFAEELSLYLVKQGWSVSVYCQDFGNGEIYKDNWKGIELIHIPVRKKGSLGSIIFDWKSILHAKQNDNKKLTLGYNTAVFNIILRLLGHVNFINMDGIEWKRKKWSVIAKVWFYINERIGCLVGNHLIADHPEIANHLATRVSRKKITMIPYGAAAILNPNSAILKKFNIEPNGYVILIARPEPENSILEIVKGFCSQTRREKLVLLGNYDPNNNKYHQKVLEAANDRVLFLGAIYEKDIISTLRFHCKLYVHGHQVGGTNPSLVEALGASSAILAHDNKFNRWVTDNKSEYFENAIDCSNKLTLLLNDDEKIKHMKNASKKRFEQCFVWNNILSRYETLMLNYGLE